MGEEPFFIDVLSDTIEKNALTDDEREFNLSILYGKDTDIQSLLNAAKRFPMMSQYHLVLVREAQSLRNLTPKERAKEEVAVEGSAASAEVELKEPKGASPKPLMILTFC